GKEGVFWTEAWGWVRADDRKRLFEIARLAAAFRGTSEFALESSQQGAACLSTLRQVWPDRVLAWLAEVLCERDVRPVPAVVLGVSSARQRISPRVSLARFLLSLDPTFVTRGGPP